MLPFRTFPVAVAMLLGANCLFADQITLKNGDRVSGKIVKKEGASLAFKADLMGEVNIKWADIASLVSSETVWVVTPDGKTISGTVQIAEGKAEVASQAGREQIPAASVQTLRNKDEQARYDRYLHPPITDLWKGYVDFGLAAASGNSETTTVTTAFVATRATARDKIGLRVNQIYAKGLVDGKTTATAKAIRAGWTYDRNVDTRLFINVFNDYESDAFQNLDLRFVTGGGLGYNAFKRDAGRLDFVAGADYQRENYSVPLTPKEPGGPIRSTRDSGEFYAGDDFAHRVTKITALKQSYRMFSNLTNAGEYRMNFDLGLDTKLRKWLSWQITFSDRYLTNPAPGRKTNDLLLTTGFRISFAQ